MKRHETCPTCGTKLGSLHDKNVVVRCESCQRINPRGFLYCGYCATPIETEAQRAELAEVAAPPGGWPNLARELRELRFFVDRGELDEADELMAILRARHPGHPALAESRVGSRGPLRPDTQVNRVVDSVLAGSSSLASALSSLASPPSAGASEAEASAAAHSGVRKRVLTSEGMRRAGAFPVVPARPTDSGSFATVPSAADPEAGKKSITGPRAAARSTSGPFSLMAKPVVPPPGAPKPQVARARTDRHFGVVPIARSDDAATEQAEREVADMRVEETVVGLPPMAAKVLAERIARYREKNAEARAEAAAGASQPAQDGGPRKPTAAELAEAELAEVEAALAQAAQSARAAASAAVDAIVADDASPETAPARSHGGPSSEPASPRPPTAAELAEAETAALGPGLTVVVPTLQPPAPFRGGGEQARAQGHVDDDPDVDRAPPAVATPEEAELAAKARRVGRGDRGKKAGRQRARPPEEAAAEERASEATPARRRIRGDRFGQHVLGRFGKKGKD